MHFAVMKTVRFYRQLGPLNVRLVVYVNSIKHYSYTESKISTVGLFYFTEAFTTNFKKSIILSFASNVYNDDPKVRESN